MLAHRRMDNGSLDKRYNNKTKFCTHAFGYLDLESLILILKTKFKINLKKEIPDKSKQHKTQL